MKRKSSMPRKNRLELRLDDREDRIINNIIDAVNDRTGTKMTKTDVIHRALLSYANDLIIHDDYSIGSILGKKEE